MNPLFYLAVWIGFALLAIGLLWWVAERSPLLEDEWQEHRLETCPFETHGRRWCDAECRDEWAEENEK